ncbi:MAG: hypothetical protein H0U57_04755 [Tatlockia sp.]|nr:hypothetical protein [Tatlockia sp.]
MFLNSSSKILLGLGNNPFYKDPYCYGENTNKPWSIPLRSEVLVKQVAAGDRHVLILYENGLLEGYGCGRYGQLGIGIFDNHHSKTVTILLPNEEIPIQIAAAGNHSLIISNKGTLYGFGSNVEGQLGCGNDKIIEFPKPISLPNNEVPLQIFTSSNRTIIACEQGEYYGFGENGSRELGESPGNFKNFSQRVPLRLKTIEALKPRTLCIGKEAVFVFSQENGCYFYGRNFIKLPVDYSCRRIKLPEDLTPKNLSFSHEHLIVISEKDEIWEAGGFFRKLEQDKEGYSCFQKIEMPQNVKPNSVYAGSETTFIGTDNFYYGLGSNNYFQLGLEIKQTYLHPNRVALEQLAFPVNSNFLKMPLSKIAKPERLFLEQSIRPEYLDNTEIIARFEEDEGGIIEINRPLNFNLADIFSMLYCFYSDNCLQEQVYLYDKKIWNFKEIAKKQGQSPVIYLDLSQLDLSSESVFRSNFKQVVADLYLIHRTSLFTGYLSDKEESKKNYQDIATQSLESLPQDALVNLLKFLYFQKDNKVKFLINTGSIHPLYDDKFVDLLKNYLDPAIGDFLKEGENPYVSQTILMGVHPSTFGHAHKRKHELLDYSSKYRPFLVSKGSEIHLCEKHFIQELKVNSEDSELLGIILDGKTVIKHKTETNKLINCLIELGLLNVIFHGEYEQLTINSQSSRNLLEPLQKKWHLQNLKRITTVWDIDNVLATHDSCDSETALFFLKKGLIINAYGISHYIPPGYAELMLYEFEHKDKFEVAFFSAGHVNRNIAFIKEFLIEVLGKTRYLSEAINTIMCSRDDCSTSRIHLNNKQFEEYSLVSQTDVHKKDISRAIAKEDEIANAILIDNEPRVVYYGQERHYLNTETVESKDFAMLKNPEIPCDSPEDPLFRKVNAAFYLAGVLSRCLKNKGIKSVTESLFELQFVKSKVNYKPDWNSSKKCLEIYQEGLAVLQKYNSDLRLITKSSYLELQQATEYYDCDLAAVYEAQANEYQDNECRIM